MLATLAYNQEADQEFFCAYLPQYPFNRAWGSSYDVMFIKRTIHIMLLGIFSQHIFLSIDLLYSSIYFIWHSEPANTFIQHLRHCFVLLFQHLFIWAYQYFIVALITLFFYWLLHYFNSKCSQAYFIPFHKRISYKSHSHFCI